jgi:hypothetical protein
MEVVQKVGSWYDSAPVHERYADSAYDVISRINNVLYEKIPIPVKWVSEDPYDSYADMKERVQKEGVLYVFTGGSNPKHMSHEDNIKGRAVHDYFGHLEADCNFSMRGEWEKYNHVKDRYPAWVRPLLFTEIVGQRAMISYSGGFDYDQKATFAPKTIMKNVRQQYE